MRLEELHKLFEDAVEFGAFPGATYAIITKDQIYTDFVGLKAKYPEEEVNDVDTIYDMASCSKVVSTTTCILKLMEEGKLRLFDTVKRYVPDFQYDNITVWNLVTHTSGLIPDLPHPAYIKTKEECEKMLMEAKTTFEPGTKIEYSDLNYIFLGKIVESISGMRLKEYI